MGEADEWPAPLGSPSPPPSNVAFASRFQRVKSSGSKLDGFMRINSPAAVIAESNRPVAAAAVARSESASSDSGASFVAVVAASKAPSRSPRSCRTLPMRHPRGNVIVPRGKRPGQALFRHRRDHRASPPLLSRHVVYRVAQGPIPRLCSASSSEARAGQSGKARWGWCPASDHEIASRHSAAAESDGR